MTEKELDSHKIQFERALQQMFFIARERNLDKEDFKQLNWITRNLDRLRNYNPDELDWDDVNKEVTIIK